VLQALRSEGSMANAVEHLIHEYQARCARNASYSLRSFAKSIGVSHTLLSLVMNRKRAVSPAMLTKLKQHIPTVNDGEIKELKPQKQTEQMQIKEFAPIANWIHYAILSLTLFQDFELDETSVARRLGVSKTQARLAIDDLKNCKVIGLDKE
ncbi:MAG: hypothetical protein NTV34_05560, partial [Proteobacteria bacterium]|nr:hypothetical protein [Pseudomonadota bacterium]